jgi:hypothetical protein
MAQRAYRHRKETTISSLEQQVNELRAANEQMSNICIGLYEDAAKRGLLKREPEFGNELKSTTEKFLALAKSVSMDEIPKDEEPTSLDGSKQSHSDAEHEAAGHSKQTQRTIPQTSKPKISSDMTSVWGYQVTQEDNVESQRDQIDWNLQPHTTPSRGDHQIISIPTFDNASFSFDNLNNNNIQQFRAEVPEVDYYQSIATIQETLPFIKSLSHYETTFGRHLQRAAVEQGWKLITATNPNPARLNDVFGFCLRFETREQIAARLKRGLDATSKQTLYNWRAPFVNLGGSGTYYPPSEETSGTMVPKYRTGMSMGPFSSSVINTRETAMFDDFRINMLGFEGEFFDSNDVESYLRHRGLDIQPNVEFVNVDLELLKLSDISSPPSFSDGNTNKQYTPPSPGSPEEEIADVIGQDDNVVPQIDDFGMGMTSNDVFSASFAEWNDNAFSKPSDNMFGLTGPMFNVMPNTENPTNKSNNGRFSQAEHIVTLSVSVLVEGKLRF